MVENNTSEAECRILCQSLVGFAPDQYIIDCYQKALAEDRWYPKIAFDRLLCRLIFLGPWIIQFLDSYTRYLFRDSLFRHRLILMVAIVENSKTGFSRVNLDRTDQSRVLLPFLCFYYVAVFAITLIIGVVVLSPIHLICNFFPARPQE
jgi:hypothetical protein